MAQDLILAHFFCYQPQELVKSCLKYLMVKFKQNSIPIGYAWNIYYVHVLENRLVSDTEFVVSQNNYSISICSISENWQRTLPGVKTCCDSVSLMLNKSVNYSNLKDSTYSILLNLSEKWLQYINFI